MKCELCGGEWRGEIEGLAEAHPIGECPLSHCAVLPMDNMKINSAIRAARKQGADRVMRAFDQTGEFLDSQALDAEKAAFVAGMNAERRGDSVIEAAWKKYKEEKNHGE